MNSFKTQYLETSLNKKVKDPYNEIIETWNNEVEKKTEGGKIFDIP